MELAVAIEMSNKEVWEIESCEEGVQQGCIQGCVCADHHGLVTIYMTHLCLHPGSRLTLVFTTHLRLRRPSYNGPDSCDMSAKQQACCPQMLLPC